MVMMTLMMKSLQVMKPNQLTSEVVEFGVTVEVSLLSTCHSKFNNQIIIKKEKRNNEQHFICTHSKAIQ